MNKSEFFFQLHQQDRPFVLGNCWNAHSAKVLEQNAFEAIGTSSAAIANSLGYEDGENISFDELFFVVERILRNVKIPVSVDMERGYGSSVNEVIRNIEKLYDAGVVGLNIEDSRQGKLESIEVFASKISDIKNHLEKRNMKMFVNVRTDAFLLKLPSRLENTLERIKVFERAGADGIFVPFVSDKDDIRKVVAATSLPVNVMYLPSLPSFQTLSELGVSRISMGTFLFRSVYKNLEKFTPNIYKEKSFVV